MEPPGHPRTSTDVHRLARVGLDALAPYGFCLAGGYAVQAHGLLDRPSEDVDLFTTAEAETQFPTAVATAVTAYLDALGREPALDAADAAAGMAAGAGQEQSRDRCLVAGQAQRGAQRSSPKHLEIDVLPVAVGGPGALGHLRRSLDPATDLELLDSGVEGGGVGEELLDRCLLESIPRLDWVQGQPVPTEPETWDQADLDAHCRASLAGYKLPRRWVTIEALPRNAYGKVVKRDLRDQLHGNE